MRIPLRNAGATPASKSNKNTKGNGTSSSSNQYALDGDVYDTSFTTEATTTSLSSAGSSSLSGSGVTQKHGSSRASLGRKLKRSLGLKKKQRNNSHSKNGTTSLSNASSQKTLDTAISDSASHTEEESVSHNNTNEYDTSPPPQQYPSESVTLDSIDWDALFAADEDDDFTIQPTTPAKSPGPAAVSDVASASNPDRLSLTHHLTRILREHQQTAAQNDEYCLCSKFFLLDNPRDQRAVATYLNQDFTDTLLEQFRVQTTTMDAHLCAARHLCQQLRDVVPVVEEYSPQPAQTMAVLLQGLQAFLYPRLSVLYCAVRDLPSDEAASVVQWIHNDLELLVMDLAPGRAILMPAWRDDADALVDLYLRQTVRPHVRVSLQGLWQETLQEQEPREDSGTFCMGSALPQRVRELYADALQQASRDLGPWPFVQTRVVYCLNGELLAAIADLELRIGSEWKTLEPPVFCAVINDVTQLSEDCVQRNRAHDVYSGIGTVLNLGQGSDDEEGDPMQQDFQDLASYAMNFLCQRIFDDVREKHALSSVGDHMWETDGSCNVVEQTISGLKVLLTDLRLWLASDQQYFRALKTSFDLLLQTYLESFYVNTMAHGVESAQVASEELGRDYLRLVIFFNGSSFEEGFYSTQHINNELRILQNMAAILNPEHTPSELHDDICQTISTFGQSGAAVLHLAGLRQRYNKGPESLQWVKAIDKAKRELFGHSPSKNAAVASLTSSSTSSSSPSSTASKRHKTTVISVPDLRNSRFLHNIQPCRSPLDRSVALATVHHSESTLNLLESSSAAAPPQIAQV